MSIHIPDDLLAAYLDGELDDAARARVEQALSGDARLARRIARQRRLRTSVRTSERPGDSSAPELLSVSQETDSTEPAEIIDLARARAQRARRSVRRRKSIPRRVVATLAASLLAGLAGGFLLAQLAAGDSPTRSRDGALLANGLLERALTDQLSATAAPGAHAVSIATSFRARTGGFCRAFTLNDRHPSSGLACREQDHWRIVALLSQDVATAGSTVRAALPLAPALQQAISDRTSGDPLDAGAEARARLNGWH